jgi:hypothetical protein
VKIRERHPIAPIHLSEFDTLSVHYKDPYGRETKLVETPIGQTMIVDEVLVVEVGDELGLEYGIGGIIGKKG